MAFEAVYIKKNVQLFDNQKNNVKELVHRRKALLTDRVGSGKTLSCLYAFAYLKEKGALTNMLVLTPLSAYEKHVWKSDILKFTNFKSIDIDTLLLRVNNHFSKLSLLLQQYDIIYGKHSHVKQCLDFLSLLASQPGMLVLCDEVHAFRNPKSQLTINFRSVALKAKNFWGITGSSLSKNIEDLYNIVNLISPWYLGSFLQFRETYCLTKNKVIGYSGDKRHSVTMITGVKDEVALRTKLAPIVITGNSFLDVKFHYIDYQLSDKERSLYQKVANGIELSENLSPQDWINFIISSPVQNVDSHKIKSVEKYSSRFIYLQTAADGVLTPSGSQDGRNGTKVHLLLSKLEEIVNKGQSVLVYFDYLSSLEVVDSLLKERALPAKVLLSTGEHVLKDSDVTESSCKRIPHIILCTRASAESVSYYFINNVIFFHIPTVPHTFIQLVGRITRKSTLYPDDLNVYIFRSNNIDLYKLCVVSSKTRQLEIVQGEERNVPSDYKILMSKSDVQDKLKRQLLWRT